MCSHVQARSGARTAFLSGIGCWIAVQPSHRSCPKLCTQLAGFVGHSVQWNHPWMPDPVAVGYTDQQKGCRTEHSAHHVCVPTMRLVILR